MAWQCTHCGQIRERSEGFGNWPSARGCPCSKDGLHAWTTFKSAADYMREEKEKREREEARSYNSSNSNFEDNSFSLFGDSALDCKYSKPQNIILLIEIVFGLIAGQIVRIDADILWNLLVYIGLQVTAVIWGKIEELNTFKRLCGSVCLYVYEGVLAQMCLGRGVLAFVLMLILSVVPYFIHVAIPNIRDGNSIFGED